jgi:hypothetical protein
MLILSVTRYLIVKYNNVYYSTTVSLPVQLMSLLLKASLLLYCSSPPRMMSLLIVVGFDVSPGGVCVCVWVCPSINDCRFWVTVGGVRQSESFLNVAHIQA